MEKTSYRDTDIIFGPRDRDILSEVGEPNVFKLSNKVTIIGDQSSREQAGKLVEDSKWLRLKGAGDEIKE